MKTLQDNLTYEQFKARADSEPSLDGDWIYRLTHVRYGCIDSYPEFEVYSEEYLFLSFADAEKHILELVEYEIGNADTYRFGPP